MVEEMEQGVSEMDRLKELGADLAPDAGDAPTAWRDRILDGPSAETGVPCGGTAWPGRRLNLGLAGAALAAVLVFATAVVGGGWPVGGSAPPSGAAEASSILRTAALVAHEADLPVPAAGQFVFTETVASPINQAQQPDGGFTISNGPRVLRQIWLSADGAQDGLIRDRAYQQDQAEPNDLVLPACSPNRSGPAADPTSDQQCVLQRGYDAEMPDSPAAVLDWLRADVSSVGEAQSELQVTSSASPDGRATDALIFQRAGELLVGGRYLTSPQRSALLDALASLPGVTVRQQAQDLANRDGVAVGMPEGTTLIFDATSFVFLGTTNSALLRQVIVNDAGRSPA
ncbi:CU044_5270 family protein [Micromonospora sp. LOL_015]|uniref:CU044_5270 family protein n=1 Tax=Micromonospora sp. LOL_015 TaxID=3345416 RepID=UPI003A8C7CE1